ncbi:hypothetical protein D9M69_584470 [compost metagenome]
MWPIGAPKQTLRIDGGETLYERHDIVLTSLLRNQIGGRNLHVAIAAGEQAYHCLEPFMLHAGAGMYAAEMVENQRNAELLQFTAQDLNHLVRGEDLDMPTELFRDVVRMTQGVDGGAGIVPSRSEIQANAADTALLQDF